tara:strand:+ start:2385 stop:3047 length:663 start_codon:yes stop_codon:yes gene_type:complete
MSRLFITPRELNLINDLAKEIVKDVIGQFIYYYPISLVKSKVHPIYEESPEKVFDNPIKLDALVKYDPQDIRANKFGSEEYYTIEAYVQARDLIDKQIEIMEGDFFSYGEVFFEVITVPDSNVIYGEIEHKGFVTITGKQARKGQFESHVFGPTDESYSDPDAVEENYYQQRGYRTNQEGITGDVRDLQKTGVLDKPLTGPKGVTKKAGGKAGSTFYGDD